MRRWASLAAVAAFMVCGCDQSPEGGSPRTSDAFTIKGPLAPPTIKQNEKETVNLSIDRKSDFKRDVRLTVKTPDHVKAELSRDVIRASDEEDFKLTLTVHKEAAIGDHIVKITGTPEGGGAPATLDMKLKVTSP